MSSHLFAEAMEPFVDNDTNDPDGLTCNVCGAPMEFVRCKECGGEGCTDVDDPCPACMGDQGTYLCFNEPHTPGLLDKLKLEQDHPAE